MSDKNPHLTNNSETAANRVANAINSGNDVIVIVGAGASAESGIPTGNQIGSLISTADQSIIKHALKKDLTEWGFFDVIDVLAKFRGDEYVRNKLAEILKPRFISLGYEILAHYLHHQKIKAVVSLNHDQAFDQSLALESPDFEHQIRSLSEFHALEERIRQVNVLPQAYLKVHGCVSRKLTFRIDRGAVVRLEPEKLGVLKSYFEHAGLILCIGWSMNDPDIFRPLAEALEESKSLVVVTKKPDEGLIDLVQGLKGDCYDICASEFLSDLGEMVEEMHTKPVGIANIGLLRHRIRADCFGQKGRLEVNDRSQAAIEVIMFALKARTQIEPRVLFDCRRTSHLLEKVGENMLRQQNREEAQVRALAEILSELSRLNILELGDGDIGPVYWLRPSRKDSNDSTEKLPSDIALNVVNKLTESYARATDSCHKKPNGGKEENLLKDDLVRHLATLTTAFDVDLIPKASDFAMFSNPTVINSKEEFESRTSELLERLKNGMSLCVSTNTGEWIRGYVNSFGGETNWQCKILIENYAELDDHNPFKHIAQERSDKATAALKMLGIEPIVRFAHNKTHQLTAVFQSSEKCSECVGAIYFRREGKSTHISPVFLDDQKDLELVAHIWGGLWGD